MKFIHLADCHLADSRRFDNSSSNLIKEKSWESFERILSSNSDADFALIAGDLYERAFFTSRDFERLFKIFEDFAKDIYYVAGNHDYLDAYNRLVFKAAPPNFHLFDSKDLSFFERDNVRIYGLSYEDRIFNGSFPYVLSLDPAVFNILLVHADISETTTNYLDLDPKKLNAIGFDYIALGHIHQPININKAYYPSSIEPFNFADRDAYGYIYYDDGKPRHMRSNLMEFKIYDFDIRDFSSADDLIAYINEDLRAEVNFVRLNLEAADNFNIKVLNNGINAAEIEVNLISPNPIKDLAKLYPDSLLTDFMEKFNEPLTEIEKRAREVGVDAILRSKR